jgi:hypothetical protein
VRVAILCDGGLHVRFLVPPLSQRVDIVFIRQCVVIVFMFLIFDPLPPRPKLVVLSPLSPLCTISLCSSCVLLLFRSLDPIPAPSLDP